MAIPFPRYKKIKDRYCIGYYGFDRSIVLKLIKARPIIENQLPGTIIYLSCQNEMLDILTNQPNVILSSDLSKYNGELACFREIHDGENTVEKLLEESNISFTSENLQVSA
jgi:hypothetical protein